MSRITEIWQHIENWYEENGASEALFPGASEADIDRLESELSVTLPAPLRESLLRHDGCRDGAWPDGVLLSVEDIIRDTTLWRGLVAEGAFEGSVFDYEPQLQRHWWGPGFIAITADGVGNFTVVDMQPGPRGTVGQVVDMDHEVGPSFMCAGFEEWLQEQADELAYATWDDGFLELG